MIQIEKNPSPQRLAELGATEWPIWEKEASVFPWRYDSEEICLLLEGDVTVVPENGEAVRFGAGDLVTFPAGLSCTWTIHQAVRKHYRFA